MKLYVIVALILVLGIAAGWIVIGTLTRGTRLGSPYEIPEGRYDCFLITQSGGVFTPQFPKPRDAYGPFPTPPKAEFEDSRELLGAKFEIGIYGREKTFARLAVEEAFRLLEGIEERLSADVAASEVSKVNNQAFDRPVELSQELHFIIKRAMEISEWSHGAFDITSGPLRRLWAHYAAYDRTPSPEEVRKARTLVGFRDLEIDDEKHTIRFRKQGMTIDLHGIIHGFALDRLAYVLRKQGVEKGYVRVGDAYYFIGHPHDQSFTLGIPDARGKMRYTFETDRPAVAVEGYYQGYKFVGSIPVSGIVDPRTGNTVGSVASCTVVGADAMTCEALANAICVMGGSQINKFMREFNPPE